jgi:hypothetical protein
MLIPSFSSKGFDIALRKNETPISEVSQYLQLFADRLNKYFLVSAYDLHHNLLESAKKLTTRSYAKSLWSHPKVLFIDSGLYERRIGADSDLPLQEMRLPQPWTETEYLEFATRLPVRAPIALVNWDRYESYRGQIDAAQEFFTRHKTFLSVFLLKPEKEGGSHNIAQLAAEARRLAAFDLIGVTEKELGSSIIDRMSNLARLHDLLVREEVDVPIHVFGALDPLYTPLYYAAGAEVFDGLSWLRYLWHDGVAVHRASLSVLLNFPDRNHQQAIEIAQARSLDKIENLERRLVNFYKGKGDWSVFGEHSNELEDAFRDMDSTL